MFDLTKFLNKAKTSSRHLRLLNFGLARAIPFNSPHGFKIIQLNDSQVETYLPYKRKNLNHLKGIHACALATLTEFTIGVFLISKFKVEEYRLILKNLKMDYHYQGKTEITAAYGMTEEDVQQKVLLPLQNADSVDIDCEVKTFDRDKNHISTGVATWQIKDWSKVKTKV